MARVRLNPALDSFVGEVGNLVFSKRYGRTYASEKPEITPQQFTEAQKAVHIRFHHATNYARIVMADVEAREPYESVAKEKGLPVQNVIIADFLRPPSIDQIDLNGYDGSAGGKIRIRASDDFDVTGVNVAISDSEGQVIEQGPAILSSMNWGRWIYTTTLSVPAGAHIRVEATATDRPGNTATKSEEMVAADHK